MKPGEIYYANLSPAVGSEMDKRRPVLIVSNDTEDSLVGELVEMGIPR